MAQLFLITEPLRGWRHVTVGSRRTRLEFAQCVKELVDVPDPDAERIVLVMDQLNIHSTASLYAAFPPRRPGGSRPNWRFTTVPNTAVG